MPEPRYYDWIDPKLVECSECSAMIPTHPDARANHTAWHASLPWDPLGAVFGGCTDGSMTPKEGE